MELFPTCKPELIKNFNSTYSVVCIFCLSLPSESFKVCFKEYLMIFCNFKSYLIEHHDGIIGHVLKCTQCDIIVPDKILMVCNSLFKEENCSCRIVTPGLDEYVCLIHKYKSILYEERPCNFVKVEILYYCTRCLASVAPEIINKLTKSGTIITCRNSPHVSNYIEYFLRKSAIHKNQLDFIQRLVILSRIMFTLIYL